MAGYKVVCVTLDYDSPHDDCRRIDLLGFRSKTGKTITRTPRQVYEMIEDEGHTVVVDYKGETTELDAATREGTRYVRAESTDTAEDPLLKKPPC